MSFVAPKTPSTRHTGEVKGVFLQWYFYTMMLLHFGVMDPLANCWYNCTTDWISSTPFADLSLICYATNVVYGDSCRSYLALYFLDNSLWEFFIVIYNFLVRLLFRSGYNYMYSILINMRIIRFSWLIYPFFLRCNHCLVLPHWGQNVSR